MPRYLHTVAWLIVLQAAGSAQAITIGSFDGSRSGRPFTGSDYSNAAAFLTNPANFGPGGTVSSPVTILPGIPTVTPAALLADNVFIMSEVTSLSAAEVNALKAFVLGGGSLLVVTDSNAPDAGNNAILSALDGTVFGSSFTGGSGANNLAISGATASINGPFGLVGSLSSTPGQAILPGSAMLGIGKVGTDVLVGEITRNSLGAGSGGVMVTGDVLFMNFFVPPGSVFNDADNRTLFANFIAQSATPAAPLTVPEPASCVLGGLGLAGLAASITRRRAR